MSPARLLIPQQKTWRVCNSGSPPTKTADPDGMKIVPVDCSPIAENMARNMFDLMRETLHSFYRHGEIRIMNMRLYETPNGYVDYPGKVFTRDMPDWE